MNFDEPEPLPEVRRPKPRVGLDIEKLINIRELREQTVHGGFPSFCAVFLVFLGFACGVFGSIVGCVVIGAESR